VLIVDDHQALVDVFVLALNGRGFEQVSTPDDISLDGVLEAADRFEAEVVLLDLYLDEAGLSIPMIRPLTSRGARVLIVTAIRDRHLLAECLEAGAAGIFNKAEPFEHLMDLIHDAVLGHSVLSPQSREELLAALREHRSEERSEAEPLAHLSPREGLVLEALMEGKSADEIAMGLYVALGTVRSHIKSILRKLGVNSQLAAVALAHRAHWHAVDTA